MFPEDTDPGNIYDLNQKFRADLLKNERAASSKMVREYGKAWKTIRTRVTELSTQYYAAIDAGKEPSVSWLFEIDRLQTLQMQTEDEIRKFAQYAEGAITLEQREAIQAGQWNAKAIMKASLPEGASVTFDVLPTRTFENLIGFLQDGSPLKDLLNELPGEAGKAVANGLQNGLLLGWNPKRTADSIRDALSGNLARALRIARTETLRSYREATRQIYKANSDVMKGWKWGSARNERTCAMCWAMDGTVHTFDEQLNDHICGRCMMIPVSKSWRELGFDLDEREGIQPATGVEAFGRLSDTEQLKILGPAKWAAFKDGKFQLADLVGVKQDARWGSMRYEKSLKEVLGEETAKKYTRLSLLGVAKDAGNYSADDLIQVAGLGLRELTPRELNKVVEHVAKAGFNTNGEQKAGKAIWNQIWNGNVIQQGDIVSPDINHYLKHVVVNQEWPDNTSYEAYIQSLKEIIKDPKSDIFVSKYNEAWQVSFIRDSKKWQGKGGYSHILVEYKVKYGYWVTGFQPRDVMDQAINNRENLIWLRRLNLK